MTTTPLQLPELPYDHWEDTKATLHLVSQIIGKVKLAHHPKQPHWWHATLRVTPRGISTQTIPTSDGRSFEIELNVPHLQLRLSGSDGHEEAIELKSQTVASIFTQTMAALEQIGHPTQILARPYDNPHSKIPFAEDESHNSWDADAIRAWWKTLLFIDEAFKTFAGRSFAKTSPAHLFWHSFDFAVTRFSGEPAAAMGQGDRRSDVEAYSHEVVSFGWWPGDPQVRYPAFYGYVAPEPKGLAESPLKPEKAWWQTLPSSNMAMLKYDDLREMNDPREVLLQFMTSAHDAGCRRAGWEKLSEQGTESFWDELDIRFPLTRKKESR
ncbi:MAG: DUF5996 family protein [Myxococcota bacterium]